MSKRVFARLVAGIIVIGTIAIGIAAPRVSLVSTAHPGAGHPTPAVAAVAASPAGSVSAKASTLQAGMRKLWEDHVTWTRLYLVSAIAGLPDTPATAERLLRNQTDIGNALKPFYGDAAGTKLTALLRDHILIAADLVTAAKAGDASKVTAARTRWYANADEIAAFLASANPTHWPAAEMRTMMREHLDLTLASATARLKSEWATDIATYDQIHQQILKMADMLSAGLIAQFPAAFR
jgi:hypothetical protein